MPNDRRDFLKQVGTGAAAVAAISKLTEQPAQAATSYRGFTAGKFSLQLDGSHVGWIQSFEGGQATADVVTEKVNADTHVAKKHLAGVKYEDITINCGTGMSKAFYEWIKASFDHKAERKDGAIVAADYNFNTMAVLKFSQALISEIGFPACDAGSKDAAKMTLKFSPRLTDYKFSVGRPVFQNPPEPDKQKKWLVSNFRLKIDGLDETSARVSKIDAITIKQTVVTDDIGEQRDLTLGPLDYSDLKITLPEHNAQDLTDWHEDFVIKGENANDKEKTGTLQFLTEDLKTTIFELEFRNLGIFKLTPDKYSSDNSDKLRQIGAEIYVEEIKFNPPGSINTDK